MKKLELFKLAGGKRQAIYLLDISTQAVSKWGDDVPPLRVFQLKVLRPQWFKKPKNIEQAAAKAVADAEVVADADPLAAAQHP